EQLVSSALRVPLVRRGEPEPVRVAQFRSDTYPLMTVRGHARSSHPLLVHGVSNATARLEAHAVGDACRDRCRAKRAVLLGSEVAERARGSVEHRAVNAEGTPPRVP